MLATEQGKTWDLIKEAINKKLEDDFARNIKPLIRHQITVNQSHGNKEFNSTFYPRVIKETSISNMINTNSNVNCVGSKTSNYFVI